MVCIGRQTKVVVKLRPIATYYVHRFLLINVLAAKLFDMIQAAESKQSFYAIPGIYTPSPLDYQPTRWYILSATLGQYLSHL